jgi:tripartite-type tricarboxylate transporter receptor subunit TctC
MLSGLSIDMPQEMPMTVPTRYWKPIRNAAIAIALPVLAIAGLVAADESRATPYPTKPIKIIVPLAPGSPIDAMARLAAPALSTQLGQPVIVENRPGGGGTIGTREVARAAPDGYTLLFVGVNHVFAPAMSKDVGYDPIKDFAPVSTIGAVSWILVVTPAVPAKSVKELVAYAKPNPGKLNWGFGQATGPHLFGELFNATTNIKVTKVPYKGGAQAIPDMLGGRIDMNFGVTANLLPLIKAGKLRALAVTGETRDPELLDVPTMSESGLPSLTRTAWSGLLAPAGTLPSIVNRLNVALNAGMLTPEMKASMTKLGFHPKIGSPEDFATLIADEIGAWGKAAKLAGIGHQ